MELLKEELEAWQEKTNKITLLKLELREKRQSFEEQNNKLIIDINELNAELLEEQDGFKLLAEEEYQNTGQKKLLGGLGIRVGTYLTYDSKAALDWAHEHKLCLALDKKEFENIAKTQDIDLVEKHEKITVTFPKEIKFE